MKKKQEKFLKAWHFEYGNIASLEEIYAIGDKLKLPEEELGGVISRLISELYIEINLDGKLSFEITAKGISFLKV